MSEGGRAEVSRNGLDQAMVESRVRQVIMQQFAVGADRLVLTTSLRNDLGADSTAMVEMMINLEGAFDAEMPDVSNQKIDTVGDIVTFIANHLAAVAKAS
jgi:acyl carrier protein